MRFKAKVQSLLLRSLVPLRALKLWSVRSAAVPPGQGSAGLVPVSGVAAGSHWNRGVRLVRRLVPFTATVIRSDRLLLWSLTLRSFGIRCRLLRLGKVGVA